MKIQSPLRVEECLAILKKATIDDTFFGAVFVEAGTIICKCHQNSFRLRQKKSYRNSFGPYFFGQLRQTDRGTEISGRFRMHPFAVIFLAVWFGGVVLIGGSLLVISAILILRGHHMHTKDTRPLIGIFIPVIMLVFGVILVKFSRRLGKSEEARISKFLEDTFSVNQTGSQSVSSKLAPTAELSMRSPIMFFSLFAVLSLVSSFTGISSIHSSVSTNHPSVTLITHYKDSWGPLSAFANSVFLGLFSYGIWKRLRLTWKVGFFLFAFSAIGFIFTVLFDLHTDPHMSQRQTIFVSFLCMVFFIPVGAFWIFWWYKKRDYFVK